MKALLAILILNVVCVLLTFLYLANTSGGETGMLSFVLLPLIGAASIITLIIALLFTKCKALKNGTGSPYAVIVFAISMMEILLFFALDFVN